MLSLCKGLCSSYVYACCVESEEISSTSAVEVRSDGMDDDSESLVGNGSLTVTAARVPGVARLGNFTRLGSMHVRTEEA